MIEPGANNHAARQVLIGTMNRESTRARFSTINQLRRSRAIVFQRTFEGSHFSEHRDVAAPLDLSTDP